MHCKWKYCVASSEFIIQITDPKFTVGFWESRDKKSWGNVGVFTLGVHVQGLTDDGKQLESVFPVCLFSALILSMYENLTIYLPWVITLVSTPLFSSLHSSLQFAGGILSALFFLSPISCWDGLVAWAHICHRREDLGFMVVQPLSEFVLVLTSKGTTFCPISKAADY